MYLGQAGFDRPRFYHDVERMFKRTPQRRAEDPVYLSGNAIGRLAGQGMTFREGRLPCQYRGE